MGKGSDSLVAPFELAPILETTAAQEEAVIEVVSILGVNPSVAKTVLMFFRWDKEQLLSTWGSIA